MTGKLAWEQQTHSLWDGGLLSTGGNLVVRGDAAGYVSVYAADTGKLLKQIDVGTSVMASPMTYRVNGVQYLSVMAGSGGGMMALPFPKDSAAYRYGNEGRIVTFRLDGGATPKPPPVGEPPLPPRPRARGQRGANRAGRSALQPLLRALSRVWPRSAPRSAADVSGDPANVL